MKAKAESNGMNGKQQKGFTGNETLSVIPRKFLLLKKHSKNIYCGISIHSLREREFY
jgi:hypothetical protein